MTKSIPITALIAIMTISITLFFVGSSEYAIGEETIDLEEEVMIDDDSTADETTGEETIDLEEEVMMDDESTVDETMDEDSMMGETVMRPLQQMKAGVDPQDVVCKEGLVLMLRTSDGSATCVTESSSTRLLDMGWGSLG